MLKTEVDPSVPGGLLIYTRDGRHVFAHQQAAGKSDAEYIAEANRQLENIEAEADRQVEEGRK